MGSTATTFDKFSKALEYAWKNTTRESNQVIQIFISPKKEGYHINDLGYVALDEVIICTLSGGEFFRNDGIDMANVQMWFNDMDNSDVAKLCYEAFDHKDWGNLTDDQISYLYALNVLSNN